VERSRSQVIVFVTAPGMAVARRIARSVLSSRAAACANILPSVESHYWWKGKLEKAGEVMIIFKTTRQCLAPLEKAVLAVHPYETPEIICMPVACGLRAYLDWIDASVGKGGEHFLSPRKARR